MDATQTKRVLIVDDEPNVTLTLAAGLEKMGSGYVFETANSGDEALAKIQQANYTLLITDFKMPNMNGLYLAQAVRKLSPDTQIILMTAHGSADVRDAAEELEIREYVDKPFSLNYIRDVVERTIGQTDSAGRVLILEDDASLRRLYEKVLSRSGYEVKMAATIAEARGLLSHNHFDVFLCDVHLGNERGTSLLEEQSAALNEQGTQVVMVSAEARYRALCEELGVDFYLEKPVSLAALVTLLDRLTARRHMRAS